MIPSAGGSKNRALICAKAPNSGLILPCAALLVQFGTLLASARRALSEAKGRDRSAGLARELRELREQGRLAVATRGPSPFILHFSLFILHFSMDRTSRNRAKV